MKFTINAQHVWPLFTTLADFCVPDKDMRPVLNRARFTFDGTQVHAEATDSYALVRMVLPTETEDATDWSDSGLYLSRSTLLDAAKSSKAQRTGIVTVGNGPVIGDGWSVGVCVSDRGEWPNTNQVWPTLSDDRDGITQVGFGTAQLARLAKIGKAIDATGWRFDLSDRYKPSFACPIGSDYDVTVLLMPTTWHSRTP